MKTFITALLLINFSAIANNWQLDSDKSTLNFVSVKKETIAETHTFEALQGTIDAQGKAKLVVQLTSVNTLIPIRNERMQTMLFETNQYTTAGFKTTIDPTLISGLAVGEQKRVTLSGELSLHGKVNTISADVVVTKLKDKTITVNTAAPIVLNAADYDLTAGVAALQAIAGLPSISLMVPVTFHLTFNG
ncbi:YceI family protein [Thalassotalea agarivorans]|uniref:Polyisoprenoid-binding protein YceI n=1 Tax=Thalassotalea agarivorans TaxID=349064 RepID=A0A1I0CV54_THASX|nr:YceI family protein [Thalassotalea agarivorans]SET23432.1 Polyisoprenoid-binding protein YceI [Thalassotalea agarivorans]